VGGLTDLGLFNMHENQCRGYIDYNMVYISLFQVHIYLDLHARGVPVFGFVSFYVLLSSLREV